MTVHVLFLAVSKTFAFGKSKRQGTSVALRSCSAIIAVTQMQFLLILTLDVPSDPVSMK